MTQQSIVPEGLLQAVDDTLHLLESHTRDLPHLPIASEPLPSLLEQCQKLCADIGAREPEPIRTIHHFACTGGTLISKHLAVMPNTRLLSEVDPFSRMPRPIFAPSDLIMQLRNSVRDVGNDLLAAVFHAGLAVVYEETSRQGERLVLRDHTQSHFYTMYDIDERPVFLPFIQEQYQTLSVVTVRHPLDTYLSLLEHDWVRFNPKTLEEYCRRQLLFLDAYQGIPLFKYEDFVAAPMTVMEEICRVLALPFNPDFQEIAVVAQLSGDSGRSGTKIAPRPRRPISAAVSQEAKGSTSYHLLCARLGYEP